MRMKLKKPKPPSAVHQTSEGSLTVTSQARGLPGRKWLIVPAERKRSRSAYGQSKENAEIFRPHGLAGRAEGVGKVVRVSSASDVRGGGLQLALHKIAASVAGHSLWREAKSSLFSLRQDAVSLPLKAQLGTRPSLEGSATRASRVP